MNQESTAADPVVLQSTLERAKAFDTRIRALEAELAKYRDAEHIYGKHFAEKAEKAEKERDALKARVRELEAKA